jgi:hypothetical protein
MILNDDLNHENAANKVKVEKQPAAD